MKIDESKIIRRFPNGMLQVLVEELDSKTQNRKYLIVDKNLKPIIDEYFCGVVYLNETKLEVYSDHYSKIGILEIGKGVDWDIKTPNEIRNETSAAFRNLIKQELKNMEPNCFCEFPRILDYIETRHSADSRILRIECMRHYLVETERSFDSELKEEIAFLKCKNCDSEYKHRYQERGIDKLEIINIVSKEKKGECLMEFAPNYLDYLYCEIFYRNSEASIMRKKLYKANQEEMKEYLFTKKL